MILIISNYRTGSTTFSKELGGDGNEWLHNSICDYRGPGDDNVYKVIPDQFYYKKYYNKFKEDYLSKADEIYFTLRQDLASQIESYVYASVTGDWHPKSIPQNTNFSENQAISYCKDMILKNLKWQKKIYKEFGGNLVWLEDRLPNKYVRKCNYTPLRITIDYDVKGMFR